MRRFVTVFTLAVVLLELMGCGAPAPAENVPSPASAPPALAQPTSPPAALSATLLPRTLQLVPSATTLPPTRPPMTPSATSLPSTPTVAAAQRGWSQLVAANAGPAARYDHTAVFDPVRQQLVIYGGRDSETFGDTWIFDRATRVWRTVDAAGSAARFGHGVVYDAAHRRMLIVMGQGVDFFNDVWAFDLDQET